MPTCPYCGATVPDGAIACGNCGASLVSTQPQASTSFQSQQGSSGQSSGSGSTSWSGGGYNPEMEIRLQNALKRNSLLTRIVTALSAITLVLLIFLII